MLNRILSLIGWLGTALIFAAAAIRFGFPAREQYVPYLAWGGIACVVAYMAGQWREIAQMFGRRQTRYGTLAGVSFLVVLGILIAVNYIGARQKKRWDLTANQAFSLSDQTRNVVSKLDSPLKISVFEKETDFGRFQDKLKEYEYLSKQISTEYIDPDKSPAVARQNQIQQYGTVQFSYKGRTERVTSDTEQDLTNGIIKVVSGQQRKVYFTSGHGEHDTTSADRDGYNAISTALVRENYTVEKLVISQAGSVPDDASVVIVAGPKIDFLAPEVDALKTYLGKAGKLLLELDPPDKVDGTPLTNLIALAHDWGMTVGTDIVVDASGMGRLFGAGAETPIAASYPSHAITQRFTFATAFPLARSVEPVIGGVSGHTAQAVVQTSAQSWAESDIKSLLTERKVAFDDGKDRKGPISVASAVSAAVASAPQTPPPAPGAPPAPEPAKPETRVVVFGDSDFAGNTVLNLQGNRDLFLNTIGWLSQQENLISVRAKEADDRRLTMTATQQANVTWLSLLIIPGFIFGTGIYTWWRRR